jgi:hypothetical protein
MGKNRSHECTVYQETSTNKADKNPCPHRACVLVEETEKEGKYIAHRQ